MGSPWGQILQISSKLFCLTYIIDISLQAPKIPGGNHLAYWDSDKASLLNNKGMEVYNHWGAVDAHVTLPDHVISQFFSTRSSYYDPEEAKVTQKQFPANIGC